MDYIYEGEVQLLQDDLDSFLEIANKLQIGGLYGVRTEDAIEPNESKFEDHKDYKENFVAEDVDAMQAVKIT